MLVARRKFNIFLTLSLPLQNQTLHFYLIQVSRFKVNFYFKRLNTNFSLSLIKKIKLIYWLVFRVESFKRNSIRSTQHPNSTTQYPNSTQYPSSTQYTSSTQTDHTNDHKSNQILNNKKNKKKMEKKDAEKERYIGQFRKANSK